MAELVCAIFNQSLVQHTFPPVWKSADVTPTPKANPPKSIESDLRPVSLLPTLAKVYESIVGRWLLDIAEIFGVRKLVPGLSYWYGVVCVILRLAILVQCRLVRDRRTDGQMDTRRQHIPRYSVPR